MPRAERSQEERDALVVEFLGAPERPPLDDDPVERVAEFAVDYLCDYGAGDPLRWNPVAVELFLADWLPRKALLTEDQVEAVPDVLRGLIRFGARKAGLGEHLVLEAVENVDRFEGEFRDAMGDTTSFGPGG